MNLPEPDLFADIQEALDLNRQLLQKVFGTMVVEVANRLLHNEKVVKQVHTRIGARLRPRLKKNRAVVEHALQTLSAHLTAGLVDNRTKVNLVAGQLVPTLNDPVPGEEEPDPPPGFRPPPDPGKHPGPPSLAGPSPGADGAPAPPPPVHDLPPVPLPFKGPPPVRPGPGVEPGQGGGPSPGPGPPPGPGDVVCEDVPVDIPPDDTCPPCPAGDAGGRHISVPNPPPADPCFDFGIGLGPIPSPGSPAWCETLSVIERNLSALGRLVLDALFDVLELIVPNNEEGIDRFLKDVSMPLGFAADLTEIILTFMFNGDLNFRGKLRQLVLCWRRLLSQPGPCQLGVLLPVACLSALLQFLGTASAGINFPVHLRFSLHVKVPQLERIVNYVLEGACPTVIPGPADSIHAYLQGQIDLSTLSCWMRAHGVDATVWEPVILAGAATLPAHDLVLYARLQGLSRDQVADLLQRHGWQRFEDREALLLLYDRPPTPNDWHFWAQTGALDDGFAARYGLDDGFPEFWASPAGFTMAAQGRTEFAALHEWRARRSPLVPQELRQLLFRLRAGRPGNRSVLDADTVKAILTHQNWPDAFATMYVDAMYTPASPQDVLLLAGLGQAAYADTVNCWLDAGYERPDAEALGQAVRWQGARAHAASAAGFTLPVMVQLVRAGLATFASFQSQLDAQGWLPAELAEAVHAASQGGYAAVILKNRGRARDSVTQSVRLAYRIGTLSQTAALAALTANGFDQPSALALLTSIDTALAARFTADSLSRLRQGYFRGEVPAAELPALLQAAGIDPPRAAQYAAAWQIQRYSRQPTLSTAQILRLVAEGLLSPKQARTRLQNLGWERPDLVLLGSEALQKLQAAQDKLSSKKARAARTALLTANRIKRAAQRELQRQEPPGKLRQWFLDEIITESYARKRLELYGYDIAAIDKYIHQWTEQRAYRDARKTPPPPA